MSKGHRSQLKEFLMEQFEHIEELQTIYANTPVLSKGWGPTPPLACGLHKTTASQREHDRGGGESHIPVD